MKRFLDPESPIMSFFGLVFDFVWLNILTLVCCIPVITAGASFTAMYSGLVRMIRGNDTRLTKHFFTDFKANFKQGTGIWVIMLAVLAVWYFDLRVVSGMKTDTGELIRVLLIVVLALIIGIISCTFLMLSHFDNTVTGTLRNGATLMLARFPLVLISVIAGLFVAYFTLRFPVKMAFVFICCGFSLPGYLLAAFLNNTLEKLEGKQESA